MLSWLSVKHWPLKMFVKISVTIVALAIIHLAEGTPTCAQITSMSNVIKKALKGNTTTGNLESKALRLGLPFVIFIINIYCNMPNFNLNLEQHVINCMWNFNINILGTDIDLIDFKGNLLSISLIQKHLLRID